MRVIFFIALFALSLTAGAANTNPFASIDPNWLRAHVPQAKGLIASKSPNRFIASDQLVRFDVQTRFQRLNGGTVVYADIPLGQAVLVYFRKGVRPRVADKVVLVP